MFFSLGVGACVLGHLEVSQFGNGYEKLNQCMYQFSDHLKHVLSVALCANFLFCFSPFLGNVRCNQHLRPLSKLEFDEPLIIQFQFSISIQISISLPRHVAYWQTREYMFPTVDLLDVIVIVSVESSCQGCEVVDFKDVLRNRARKIVAFKT
ncbi:hypothetical protein BD289DRAFT_96026 [Coniella lustricola]|uniref:Uncharacterized protein n=1 Tax=Coniella lustricola TaxID=2025994 RepID=A0A2T2ZY33_9PEZI|nr:hypothetical protein BD289DRAFT_96026 [Coniella lustricola]